MSFRSTTLALAWVSLTALTAPAPAMAGPDDEEFVRGRPEKPLIQIGGAVRSDLVDIAGDGVDVLVRVGFRGVRMDGRGPFEELYIARVKAQLDFDTDWRKGGDSDYDYEFQALRGYSVEFTPVTGISGSTETQVLPITVSRDRRLNQDLSIKISAIGIGKDVIIAQDGSWTVAAAVAVNAMGYKMEEKLDSAYRLDGLLIGGAAAEIATTLKVAHEFSVTLAVGASGDLAWEYGNGNPLLSARRFYTALRADLRDLTLFAEVGRRYSGNLSDDLDDDTVGELLIGADFKF